MRLRIQQFSGMTRLHLHSTSSLIVQSLPTIEPLPPHGIPDGASLLRSQSDSHPLAPPISRLLASTTADLLCFRGWPTVLVLKLMATEDFAHFLSPVLMICSYICSYLGGCFSNLTELHSISHLAFPAPSVLGLANFFPEAR